MRKVLQSFLLPFSFFYGLILALRHWLYNIGFFSVNSHFSVPVLCVGNLNLGGTGKTPFTAFLLESLSNEFTIGIVSRGYGRKTRGFLLAGNQSTTDELGDEPFMLFQKYKKRVLLAVSEDRTSGVNQLLKLHPEINLIILDDAFQHRKIQADINILLSLYTKPYYKDELIPAGGLRDIPSAAGRADFLVLTKTNEVPSALRIETDVKASNFRHLQKLFYSRINYLSFRNQLSQNTIQLTSETQVLVVTGIAKPQSLLNELEAKTGPKNLRHLSFPDHHEFKLHDIAKIEEIFGTFAGAKKAIICTEKDWVKLAPLLKNRATAASWFVAEIVFEINDSTLFLEKLKQRIAFVTQNK